MKIDHIALFCKDLEQYAEIADYAKVKGGYPEDEDMEGEMLLEQSPEMGLPTDEGRDTCHLGRSEGQATATNQQR